MAQAGIRANPGVMPLPVLDHPQGFESISKPLHGQALIAELAVEAFRCSVLPLLTWVDQRAFYSLLANSLE